MPPIKEYPNGRRCACGKILSTYNPGPKCYRCGPTMVKTMVWDAKTARAKFIKEPLEPEKYSPPSKCSSRETSGFNIVYRDYYGKDP